MDESALVVDSVEMAVQINGKVRGTMYVSVDMDKDEISEKAQELPEIQRFIKGKVIRKCIVIPKRVVNIVV